jgi:AmmeMemoRadiSam system protein A
MSITPIVTLPARRAQGRKDGRGGPVVGRAGPRRLSLHSTLARAGRPRHPLSRTAAARPATKQLDRPDQLALLALARASIGSAVRHRPDDEVERFEPSPPLIEPGAAFVTIHERGDLRGCIGLLRFEVPLWINVREAAAAAALDDPRFLPVDERELPMLELEVSVLEPPVEIPDASHFVAGRHGIVVERGGRRALLLPQVAGEMGWGAEQMLDAVCRKAGLPGDAWKDRATKLSTFEASYFDEDESPGDQRGEIAPER